MAGGAADWETLINHQSSLLTETKDLVGMQRELIKESKAQSRQNKWTLTLAVLALVASTIIPFIVS